MGPPESLLHQPRPLHILLKEQEPAATDTWQTPNDVRYCQQLPTVQAGGGLQ